MSDGKARTNAQRLRLERIDAEILRCAIEGKSRLDCAKAHVNAEVLNALALEKYEKLDLSEPAIKNLIKEIEKWETDCNNKTVHKPEFEQLLLKLSGDKETPVISPKGIRLENAVITGQLDLEDCQVRFPLSFYGCTFGDPDKPKPEDPSQETAVINIKDATVQSLVFRYCEIFGILDARRLKTKGNVRLQGCRVHGRLSFMGARIGRNLELGQDATRYSGEFSEFEKRSWDKLVIEADRVQVGSSLIMRGIVAAGETRLVGAKIKGKLDAMDAQFINPKGDALNAYRMEVGGDFMVQEARLEGEMVLRGAKIGGDFEGQGGNFLNKGGIAIKADRIEIANDFRLGRMANVKGVVRCPGAKIGGQMYFDGSSLDATTSDRRALYMRGASIGGSVYLTKFKDQKKGIDAPFVAHGEINFNSAEIADRLILRGGKLYSSSEEKSKVKPGSQSKKDDDSYQDDEHTALSLQNAKIAHLIMPRDERNTPEGIVDLTGAQLGTFEDYAVAWPKKASRTQHMKLDGLRYEHLKYPDGKASKSMAEGSSWQRFKWNVSRKKADMPAVQRIKWLKLQSPDDLGREFKPGPWMQVARALKVQGHIKNAQDVLIERQRQRRKNYPLFGVRWFQDTLLYVTARYGFRPWLTVIWIIATIASFAALWQVFTSDCDQKCWAEQKIFVRSAVDEFTNHAPGAPQDTYPPFSPVLYSFDTFIPLFEFKFEHSWMVRTTYCPLSLEVLENIWKSRSFVKGCAGTQATAASNQSWLTLGGLFYAAYIIEILLGIILTSIAVTGFAGYLGRID